MAIPYTGLSFAASCNSRSSHGQYTRSSTEHFQYGAVTSARLLGQNYRNRNYSKVRNYVLYEHSFFLTQQWLLLAPDRPYAQHVQSTRRMSLTVKRPSTKGSPFLLLLRHAPSSKRQGGQEHRDIRKRHSINQCRGLPVKGPPDGFHKRVGNDIRTA
jgi:hypothetical protein